MVAIPTTAGTGSEVGRAALITLADGRKPGFISPHLIPKAALCDPLLTLGLRFNEPAAPEKYRTLRRTLGLTEGPLPDWFAALTARLRDALPAAHAAALPRAGRKARIGCDLAAVAKTPEQALQPEQARERRGDALQRQRARRRCRRILRGQGHTLGLDRDDLALPQGEPMERTADLGPEPGGQWAAVAGAQHLEPLAHQDAALARQPPTVPLLRAGRDQHGTDPWLAASERQQRARQRRAIDRVRLGAPMATRDGDRCRRDNMALDPVRFQQAMDPEPVQPVDPLCGSTLDRHDPHRLAKLALGSGALPGQQVEQRRAVPAGDGVPRHGLAA